VLAIAFREAALHGTDEVQDNAGRCTGQQLHTIFAETRPFTAGPIRFDLPILSSLNPWALMLPP
jgi:hypothetical protein